MKPLYGFCFMTPFPALGQASARYQNPNLPAEQRAADLVSRMTVEEKVLQMQNSAPAIPRLGVPVYNWWNEALHGVASRRATVFPDFQEQPKLKRTESRLYYDANMQEPEVMTAINGNKYSICWTGTLTPPGTGEYVLSARTGMWNRDGKVRLFVDDKEMSSGGPGGPRPAGLGPGQGQGQGSRRGGPPPIHLEGGHSYSIRVDYQQNGPSGGAELNWVPPTDVLLEQARNTVKDADAVLVFAGLNSSLEGEGHDRSSIDLPEPQESMVKAMIASGKSVVVVLTSGSAIAANSEAANATAVLSTVTFYKSLDQLPEFTDYSMQGRTYRYFKGEPLYPFGYGLSYSTFAYSGLKARRTADGAQIRATVKNTSSRDGDEVVQLYVSGGPGEEIRSLRGFQRIHLRAGESCEVRFTLAHDDVPQSKLEVSVGGGQPLDGVQFVKGSL